MAQASAGTFGGQVQEAAQRARLGAYRGGYQGGAGGIRVRLWLGTVLCALFGVAALAALVSGYPELAVAAGIPFLVFAVRMALSWRVGTNAGELHLYEGGVVVVHKDRVRTVRYADSTVLDNTKRETQYGSTLATVYSFGLTDTEGRNLVIGSAYPGGEVWGPWVQQDSAAAQLPGALARLRAGEKIEFGLLWVTAGEIGTGKNSAPWQQVEIDIKDGSITVRAAGRRGSLANSWVRLTPNFSLFHALTDVLRQGRLNA
ncbi:DUF6585 family protein [Streptomyces polyrhachis]|uniref:DUF6585 family protein n=1 Tax=Streptomyces polyrhachis TaxID=1282885 RepID=A0ABW2GFC0_9ACTN